MTAMDTLAAIGADVARAPAFRVVRAFARRLHGLRLRGPAVSVRLDLPRHGRGAHLQAPRDRRRAQARFEALLYGAPVVVIQVTSRLAGHGVPPFSRLLHVAGGWAVAEVNATVSGKFCVWFFN